MLHHSQEISMSNCFVNEDKGRVLVMRWKSFRDLIRRTLRRWKEYKPAYSPVVSPMSRASQPVKSHLEDPHYYMAMMRMRLF